MTKKKKKKDHKTKHSQLKETRDRHKSDTKTEENRQDL